MASNMNNRSYARNSQNSNMNNEPRGMQRNENSGSGSNISRDDLMRAIMEADFVATDLKLYLDTHPDDERALELYREAVRQYKACKAAFEDTFYPLNATAAGRNGEWDWLCGTFPPLS